MDPFKERPEAGHADAHGWLLHLQLCLDCQHLLLGSFNEHLPALLPDTNQDAPAKYLLATGVYSFFGGFVCLLVGLYSYLADISSVQTRTTR